MDAYDASQFNAAGDSSESWMDKLRPWKKQDTPASYPSGVSGAVLSGFEGQAPPASDPGSEAEMLLAKQELLLALLADTEQALMGNQR